MGPSDPLEIQCFHLSLLDRRSRFSDSAIPRKKKRLLRILFHSFLFSRYTPKNPFIS